MRRFSYPAGPVLRRQQAGQQIGKDQDHGQHTESQPGSTRAKKLAEKNEAQHRTAEVHEAFEPGSQSAAVFVNEIGNQALLCCLGQAG